MVTKLNTGAVVDPGLLPRVPGSNEGPSFKQKFGLTTSLGTPLQLRNGMLLSLTSMAGPTPRVCLAYVFPYYKHRLYSGVGR